MQPHSQAILSLEWTENKAYLKDRLFEEHFPSRDLTNSSASSIGLKNGDENTTTQDT